MGILHTTEPYILHKHTKHTKHITMGLLSKAAIVGAGYYAYKHHQNKKRAERGEIDPSQQKGTLQTTTTTTTRASMAQIRITTATARASSNIRSSRTAIHHMPALTGRASMPLAQSTRLANEEHWNGGVLEY